MNANTMQLLIYYMTEKIVDLHVLICSAVQIRINDKLVRSPPITMKLFYLLKININISFMHI